MANKKPYIFFPIHNKYYKWYFSIIYLAKKRNWSKSCMLIYTEYHHIIPLSLGGNDNNDNIVTLTLKEHFICHKLLIKMFPYKSQSYIKMVWALERMTHSSESINRNIELFKFEKYINYSKNLKTTLTGIHHPNYGKIFTQEHISKINTLERNAKIANTVAGTYRIVNITDNIDYGIVRNLREFCKDKPEIHHTGLEAIAQGRIKIHRNKKWIVKRLHLSRYNNLGFHSERLSS